MVKETTKPVFEAIAPNSAEVKSFDTYIEAQAYENGITVEQCERIHKVIEHMEEEQIIITDDEIHREVFDTLIYCINNGFCYPIEKWPSV